MNNLWIERLNEMKSTRRNFLKFVALAPVALGVAINDGVPDSELRFKLTTIDQAVSPPSQGLWYVHPNKNVPDSVHGHLSIKLWERELKRETFKSGTAHLMGS